MLRDIVGAPEQQLDWAGEPTIQALFNHYSAMYPRIASLASSIVMARNQEFSQTGTRLEDGDEIAFLPPVSGGAGPFTHVIEEPGGNFYALTRDPIDSSALMRRLLRGEDGAAVTFEGVVRNNTKGRSTKFLDYECYEPMAIKIMAQIGSEIASSQPIGRVGMIHRLGRMEIGEASVVVVVTSPHRVAAFAAALEGINRLKKLVPIWKKEHFEDGEIWVEGEWDQSLLPR
jgi:molybdopterin synthase catalytic subunit/molybdopterin converting factor small subunit